MAVQEQPSYPGFTRLSPVVYYYVSPRDSIPSGVVKRNEPDLILLTSWMNASPRHIAKYLTAYQKLFPTSCILLVSTSSFHFLVQSARRRSKELEPVQRILMRLQPQDGVLLHMFSNGGATAALSIARTYRNRTGRPLQISRTVFDSNPGTVEYASAVRAFSAGLPKAWLLRVLGVGVFRVIFFLWYVWERITRRDNIITRARKGLNDPGLLPSDAARLYIYSDNDQLVRFQDVEAHATDARSQGLQVYQTRYKDSAHVAHMMQDQERYFKAVTQLWDS